MVRYTKPYVSFNLNIIYYKSAMITSTFAVSASNCSSYRARAKIKCELEKISFPGYCFICLYSVFREPVVPFFGAPVERHLMTSITL